MWLPRQHQQPIVTSQSVFTVKSLDHCPSSHFMNRTVTSALAKQHFVHCKFEQNHSLVTLFVSWILLCKLTFSFIQINTSNIKLEIRIHQLNEKVNSISGFDMFFLKLNFATYKCMSIPPHIYICCQNIHAKCSILQQNMQCHINKSYVLTSLKYLKLD